MKKNKRVLLTGASSGIGEQMAYLLSEKGFDLVLVARREGRLKNIAQKCQCEFFVADLSKENEINQLIKKYPETDILINNAGYALYGNFHNMGWNEQKDIIFVNAVAPVNLMYQYIGGMKKSGFGRILNVASTAGSFPTPYMSVYGAAKAFLIHLSEAVALEMKGSNVKISCLLPGPTATEFWDVAGMAEKVAKVRIGYDSPRGVAEIGINLMEKGMISDIPGLKNKIKQFIKFIMPSPVRREVIRRHLLHSSLDRNKPRI